MLNRGNIEKAKYMKNNVNKVYYATQADTRQVVTDFDHFPYQRFYRGIHNSEYPTIIEREAGYRQQEQSCYREKLIVKSEYPKHCFEGPASVVYPCYPDYLRKYSDKAEMEIMLNRVCVDRSV
jgi:hypothetical protein